MAVLRFSLTPDATGKIYELLVCLAKFGESVLIEARGDKLTLMALNLSHTAYASFTLDSRNFFTSYAFNSTASSAGGDRFTCQLYNKALQSVFKGRTADARGGRETAIDRCDVSIQDQADRTECRLVVKMLCKHGMTKVYRLTYEPANVMHAIFDRSEASQGWQISSRVMREYVEYFGPKTEQLAICAQEEKVIFTSFTEKIQDGKEVLKQPLETVITLHKDDFDDFHMQERMQITISVKDFKAIVAHAETLHTTISAHFSYPSRPLQFSYQNECIHCSFTLMTTRDYRESSSTPAPNFISTRSASSRQTSMAPPPPQSRTASEMPPPARPVHKSTPDKPFSSQRQRKPLKPERSQVSVAEQEAEESLFMPPGDDDRAWDPPNLDDDDPEEMLGWDANNERNSGPTPTFRDSGSAAPPSKQLFASRQQQTASESFDGLEATQRLSQLHGMFD